MNLRKKGYFRVGKIPISMTSNDLLGGPDFADYGGGVDLSSHTKYFADAFCDYFPGGGK